MTDQLMQRIADLETSIDLLPARQRGPVVAQLAAMTQRLEARQAVVPMPGASRTARTPSDAEDDGFDNLPI